MVSEAPIDSKDALYFGLDHALFLKVGLTLYRASISDDSLIEQLVSGALLFAVEIISIGATMLFTLRQSLGIP